VSRMGEKEAGRFDTFYLQDISTFPVAELPT
jgi:hypothetical protein